MKIKGPVLQNVKSSFLLERDLCVINDKTVLKIAISSLFNLNKIIPQ